MFYLTIYALVGTVASLPLHSSKSSLLDFDYWSVGMLVALVVPHHVYRLSYVDCSMVRCLWV